jgi:murein DD-endopeptidase MepM/ murein hydrolase activator NlpD
MLFAADNTWWEAGAARPRPHEGLDLRTFIDTGNRLGYLEPGTKVPVLWGGQVVAIFADFLGHSILVAHDLQQSGARLHSIYAHIDVEPRVAIGQRCGDGEIIGRIAASRKAGIPSHLHLSIVWNFGAMPDGVSWPMINASAAIRLCDPMQCIDIGDLTRDICDAE